MYISITNTHWKKLTIPKETPIPPPKVKLQKIQPKPYQEVIRNKSHLEEKETREYQGCKIGECYGHFTQLLQNNMQ